MTAPSVYPDVLGDLGSLITAAGLATLGDNLFLGSEPDQPDDVTTLYEYLGAAPAYIQERQSPAYVSPRVQVVSRSKEYTTAERHAWEMFGVLSSGTVLINGNRYVFIHPLSQPGLIGRDANDRVLVAFNVEVERAN